jgi:outer membrane protein OmpA-like peptidoglycan-associated protein
MAGVRRLSVFIASMSFAAVTAQPLAFPVPAAAPEAVSDTQDFPYLPALPGARLIATKGIGEPLELKQATEDEEAVLAGMSYIKKVYDRPGMISAIVFVSSYRDALFAAGWKLIDVTKLEEIAIQPETVNVAAHYILNGRNIYARLSQEPGGPYEINVADVGEEDWASQLEKQCRVRLYSVHFDLDRSTIKPESTPTLEKAAAVLKATRSSKIEVQGHMDNIGAEGDAVRQMLSEARAKSVAGWLTTHGVAASRVTAKGYGKTRPIAENDSDLGRALNRRIELARTDCASQSRTGALPR